MEQEDKKAEDLRSVAWELLMKLEHSYEHGFGTEECNLLQAALTSARIEGRREMRDKIADMMLEIDNTYLGPKYRQKLRDHLRAIEPEGI